MFNDTQSKAAVSRYRLSPHSKRRWAMKHTEGFLKLVGDAKRRVREIDVAQTRKRMGGKGTLLIDVREDDEWRAGHATGAEHLGKGVIERDIETKVPDKNTELILYCGGGYRSALAADALQKMGYKNVYSMEGGWKAWKESGAPITTD
jgi:rhodanese-related sulfurtransferase